MRYILAIPVALAACVVAGIGLVFFTVAGVLTFLAHAISGDTK